MIESAHDDIGASDFVVNLYKDILNLCHGVLNIKNNGVSNRTLDI
jgi:hypothetical protein